MDKKIRIGALLSGNGTNLQAILEACQSGKIDGRIVFVGSDNPDARGLERASQHGIHTFMVDYASIIRSFQKDSSKILPPDDFDLNDVASKQSFFPASTDAEKMNAFLIPRAVAEAMLIDEMKSCPFDLLVLAGFMRKLSPYFIDRVNTKPGIQRIMNIHPALLPSFPGVDGYGDTFRYGCKVAGCTVHFIDYGEDTGPIIGQKAFKIEPDDTIDSIKAKGLKLEWELYPACVQLFAEGRLQSVKMTYTLKKEKTFQRTIVRIRDKD